MMPIKTDRIQIDYELTFHTLFHCGTGVRADLIDRTVVRDGDGDLYVPGSTFKGVLREHCEQLSRLYLPAQTAEPGQEEKAAEKGVASPHNAEAALLDLGSRTPTMVTRIFGSQISPGRLFFDDAILIGNKDDKDNEDGEANEDDAQTAQRVDRNLQVDIYTQARLDRLTRTATSGALYTSEFGTRELAFRGSILGWLECTAIEAPGLRNERHPDETPTYSLLLLLAGLRMVTRLGGNKSTGKGYCECALTGVAINGHPVNDWLSWLEQLDELANYPQAERRAGA